MTKVSLRHTMNHRDLLGLFRSSHWRCSVKKVVLKTFTNFTGEHLSWSLFLITLQVFRPATFLKRDSKRLLLFVSVSLDKTRSRQSVKYFFKRNNSIQSNPAISFIYKLKNDSLTFQLTFLLNF